MKTIIFLSALAGAVFAGGYKIPETSLNSVALSAANVAHAWGADTAYYNPANMVFMKDENTIDANLMYIGLSDTNYKGTVSGTGPYDINSKRENFLVPSLHYVSGDVSSARYGLSIVSPGGLTKRWEEQPAKTSAQEFTLKTIEVNPTVALKVADNIGVALGIRAIYSDGIVKSSGAIAVPAATLSRDMTGDSIDFGYNIALSYKPTADLDLALTYRSKIDLTLEGDAKLNTSFLAGTYNGGTNGTVPLPALLNVAVAYTLPSKTTIEFVYERNYWHSYSELDFNYDDSLTNPVLVSAFDDPKAKNWKDTNTFRIGVTQELNELTLMCGLVIDETPIPDSTLSFELPDSDSVAVSLGGRYQINEKMNVGLAALYSMKDDRASNNSLVGEFTDSNALIISAGLEYRF